MERIVVGIDGSSSGRRAIKLAGEMARMYGAELVVVSAWQFVPAAGYAAVHRSADEPERQAWQIAADDLASLAMPDNLSRIRVEVVEGNPSAVLIDHARDARLLVMGSGHSNESGAERLGAVSLEVLRHATCPVLIVPPPARDNQVKDIRELVDASME